jgi:trk system potassium uptake protein
MIQFRYIFFLIGWLLLILAGAVLLPLFTDLYFQHPDFTAYLASFLIMVFFGLSLVFVNRTSHEIELTKRDTFLLTVLAWIIALGFCSLPFYLASPQLNLTDSLFETTSGLTTTGSTVMMHLDITAPGILMWRATLQWLGGIGIVVMALTIMPTLRIGGMELFQTESSEKSEKFLPRIKQIAKAIFMTYVGLTIICFLCLCWAGMGWFDAICHTFSTVSTGGFSTHDNSIAYFSSPPIKIILIIFMILGGLPQLLLARLLKGQFKNFFKDLQTKMYIQLMVISALALILWRMFAQSKMFHAIALDTIFNIVSIITTSGFEDTNYALWGSFATVLFFVLTFIGGCTGSTSGGIKIFRLQILGRMSMMQLRKSHSPFAVFVAKYNHKAISESVFYSTASFFVIFLGCYIGIALLLGMLGLDFTRAVSASVATLSNVGISFGSFAGSPSTSAYAFMDDSIKWVLMIGMLLGRLEFLTVLVLFLPSFWRD